MGRGRSDTLISMFSARAVGSRVSSPGWRRVRVGGPQVRGPRPFRVGGFVFEMARRLMATVCCRSSVRDSRPLEGRFAKLRQAVLRTLRPSRGESLRGRLRRPADSAPLVGPGGAAVLESTGDSCRRDRLLEVFQVDPRTPSNHARKGFEESFSLESLDPQRAYQQPLGIPAQLRCAHADDEAPGLMGTFPLRVVRGAYSHLLPTAI